MEFNTQSHQGVNTNLFKGRSKHASRILDKIKFEKEACLIESQEPQFLYF